MPEFGDMPVVWRMVPVLSGQIWCRLVVFLLAAALRRMEPEAEGRDAAGDSINKAWMDCLISVVRGNDFFLPERGGSEKRKRLVDADFSGVRLYRSTTRWSTQSAACVCRPNLKVFRWPCSPESFPGALFNNKDHLHPSRHRTRYLHSTNGFPGSQMIMPRQSTLISLQIVLHDVYAIFVPLGLIRRRRVRAPPWSFPRFSGEDVSNLSSVWQHFDQQLKLLPPICLPIQLLVEPLALWLETLYEAPKGCNRRIFVFGFSPDLLIGSGCNPSLRHLVSAIVFSVVSACWNPVFRGTGSLSFDVTLLTS